jgi:hypothetical protein
VKVDPGPLEWLEPSRLELLADDAGLAPERVRELVRQAVQQAQGERADPIPAPTGRG